ncbi:MAG: DivIVA domain-containing protein [Desulfobacterales bacterium]
MQLKPVEIQEHQFKIKFRGFDVREVDDFLDRIAQGYETLLAENARLKAEIDTASQNLAEHRQREKTFQRTLQNSQQVVEQLKKNARKSAELIITNAEGKAERMLNRAYNRLSQFHEDIAQLKRQRIQIQQQIRTIVETHSKMLDMSEQEMQAMEEQYTKVKVLKPAR